MPVYYKTKRADIEVHRGAPQPIVINWRVNTLLQPFSSSLRLRAYYSGVATINLTVGAGITLSTAESVPYGQATITFSEAQSRTIPDGPLMVYEIETGSPGAETPVLMGRLIGVGGYNADD